MCVALVVGNSIGSGVFLLPAALAPYGLNSVIAWAFTAGGALVLAIVFAQLSRAFPRAGGPYAYVNLAFGPFTAFIVAWGYWISIWVGNVSIATGAVSYLSPLMPWIATVPGASAAVTLLCLWLLTFVNCYGIRASGWVQSVTTVLKVLPLIAISALGLFSVRAATVTAAAGIPLSVSGTTAAATVALWALLGLESATIPASKVRDPGRIIPRATLLGAALTALICIVACTTVLLLVPPKTLASSNAPFADLAAQYWGAAAGKIVAVFAAISGFGCLNGWILLQGELPNVMAKNGVFPRIFARDSARFTPTFRSVVQQRSGEPTDSVELPKIMVEDLHPDDSLVDDGLPGDVLAVLARAVAPAVVERNPHQLIEGAIIAGFAIEADIAYIFLRGEYTLAAERISRAIAEAYERNYLGKTSSVPVTAWSYICTSAAPLHMRG